MIVRFSLSWNTTKTVWSRSLRWESSTQSQCDLAREYRSKDAIEGTDSGSLTLGSSFAFLDYLTSTIPQRFGEMLRVEVSVYEVVVPVAWAARPHQWQHLLQLLL